MLDGNIDDIQPGTVARETFEEDFINDIAGALGIEKTAVAITDIKSGSIVVTFEITSNSVAAANQLGSILTSMVEDKNSALYSGKVTKNSTSISQTSVVTGSGEEGPVTYSPSDQIKVSLVANTVTLLDDGQLPTDAVRRSQLSKLDMDLQTSINAERDRAVAAEEALTTRVSGIVEGVAPGLEGKIEDVETALQASIAAEETRAREAEAAIDARVTEEVARLVNGAPDILDTLNELATSIGNDPNAVATLTTLVGAERARAEAVEATLMKHTNGSHTGVLQVEDIVVNKNKHLYFGDQWRVKGTTDGTSLVFEMRKPDAEGVSQWSAATPLISVPPVVVALSVEEEAAVEAEAEEAAAQTENLFQEIEQRQADGEDVNPYNKATEFGGWIVWEVVAGRL